MLYEYMCGLGHHVCFWYPQRTDDDDEGIRFSGAGIAGETIALKHLVGAGN